VTIVQPGDVNRQLRQYLSVEGTAYIEEGGAPELLTRLSEVLLDPNQFPPKDAPPGFITHIRVEKVGGVGPWA
jgi:hypothetical protein